MSFDINNFNPKKATFYENYLLYLPAEVEVNNYFRDRNWQFL